MKAIQTKYKGYRFRSRLEARWAVFFDALSLKWEYEPEGFDLGFGELYLPDFKVLYPGREKLGESHYEWFEVKGDLLSVTASEWRKLMRFHVQKGLIVLDGTPDCRMYLTVGGCLSDECDDTNSLDPVAGPFVVHPAALQHERAGLALWCSRRRLWWDEHSNFFSPSSDFGCGEMKLEQAVAAARSARFEHGESGAAR